MYLPMYLSTYLPVYLSICKLENEAIPPDFLNFWVWQHQKSSKFARLPQFLNLTASKRKQFCEISLIFEVGNIKNEAILRDFLQKWKDDCRADGLVQMRFAFFHSSCLKYCACHEKVRPGHTKCCTYHTNSFSQSWRSDAPKFTPSQEINISDGHVFCIAPARESASFQILFKCPTPAIVFGMLLNPLRWPRKTTSERPKVVWSSVVFNILTWKNVLRATEACTFSTSQLPKVLQTWRVLYMLTWKCASRHSGVHFFDILVWTSCF